MTHYGNSHKKRNIDAQGYRANVGIIICNTAGQLLWARRVRKDGWQFPQGGIEYKESPREAAFRELYEEVGLYPHHVRLLAVTDKWYRYDVPIRRKPQRGRFRGQKQQWFLFHLIGDESSICMTRSDKPEFDSWRWVDYWHPLDDIIAFKRDVYKKALAELEPVVQKLAHPVSEV